MRKGLKGAITVVLGFGGLVLIFALVAGRVGFMEANTRYEEESATNSLVPDLHLPSFVVAA